MFSLIRNLILLALCLVVVGIFCGWFTFSGPRPNPAGGGRVDINVSVDPHKIDTDVQRAEQKVSRQWQDFENAQQPQPQPRR
jgi:hypothetical protein